MDSCRDSNGTGSNSIMGGLSSSCQGEFQPLTGREDLLGFDMTATWEGFGFWGVRGTAISCFTFPSGVFLMISFSIKTRGVGCTHRIWTPVIVVVVKMRNYLDFAQDGSSLTGLKHI